MIYFFKIAIFFLFIAAGFKLYSTISISAEEVQDMKKAEIVKDGAKDEEIIDLMEDISYGEAKALMHLSERYGELQKMENELRNREKLIEATREHIEKRIMKLQELKGNIEDLLSVYNAKEEARVKSLAKIYENMKPQNAAEILDELDIDTLLQVINYMKDSKVSALLARMRPERARQITVHLTSNDGDLDPKKYNLCLCE